MRRGAWGEGDESARETPPFCPSRRPSRFPYCSSFVSPAPSSTDGGESVRTEFRLLFLVLLNTRYEKYFDSMNLNSQTLAYYKQACLSGLKIQSYKQMILTLKTT